MIGSDLLRYQPDQRYLIFDEETEGLHLKRSRIWQLAYAICTLKEIESIVVRHIYWKDLNVSPGAARVTRFNKQHYLSVAEPPEKVFADFDPLLNDPTMIPVYHNGLGLDVYPWDTLRAALGHPSSWEYLHRSLDTNALGKAYRKGFKPEGDRLAFQYKCLQYREKKSLKTSLGALAKEFKVPYDERYAHDAGYDIRVNHGVLKELIGRVEI